MGRRIITISMEFLQGIFTTGHIMCPDGPMRIENGLPAGARLLRAWHDDKNDEWPYGVLTLLFEHESWPDTEEGQPFEVISPRYISDGVKG